MDQVNRKYQSDGIQESGNKDKTTGRGQLALLGHVGYLASDMQDTRGLGSAREKINKR